jgi:magnesium chelatase subunit H
MPSIRRDLRSNRSDPRTALERLVVEETHKIGISLNSLVSQGDTSIENDTHRPNIVLVAGFESFNKELYQASADSLDIGLRIFTDSEIRRPMAAVSSDENNNINPEFRRAMESADAFVGSLIFDYDDVLALQPLLSNITGPRLLFECATELMSFNHIGTFSMAPKVDDTTGEVATLSAPGPPPYVQAILSKFSSNKEEDKLSAYLKLLKIGPDLLKYVPGNKAGDLRTWLEAYRYWNQGGASNVNAMLQILAQRLKGSEDGHEMNWTSLPELEVTPDIGLLHPLLSERETGISNKYFTNPKEYIKWRESKGCEKLANEQQYHLAPLDSPRVAILLYRKHVITKQRYINELITLMEEQDVLPIPIFINGVEAHTIVRDWLTSMREIQGVRKGIIQRDSTYQSRCSAEVDIIVNTIGFPLVGGPAGSMEAGRNIAVAEKLLSDMNVPYIVASPLLLQSIQQWKTNGVLGLQSVVLYSLPELDGAIDTVVLGGLVGDKIVLVNERVRKLTDRVKGMFQLVNFFWQYLVILIF